MLIVADIYRGAAKNDSQRIFLSVSQHLAGISKRNFTDEFKHRISR